MSKKVGVKHTGLQKGVPISKCLKFIDMKQISKMLEEFSTQK